MSVADPHTTEGRSMISSTATDHRALDARGARGRRGLRLLESGRAAPQPRRRADAEAAAATDEAELPPVSDRAGEGDAHRAAGDVSRAP